MSLLVFVLAGAFHFLKCLYQLSSYLAALVLKKLLLLSYKLQCFGFFFHCNKNYHLEKYEIGTLIPLALTVIQRQG